MKALHEVFAKVIGEEDWYPVTVVREDDIPTIISELREAGLAMGLPGVEVGTRVLVPASRASA